MKRILLIALCIPLFTTAQTFTFQSKYQPVPGEIGFAFRGEVRVTQTNIDKYKRTYSVKLVGLTIDSGGFWVGQTFYNCIDHPEICNGVTDRDFYLAQVALVDDCNPKGFGLNDFSNIGDVNEGISSAIKQSCNPGFPSTVILKVSTSLKLVDRINQYLFNLKKKEQNKSTSSSKSTSSTTSANKNSSASDVAPSYGTTSTTEAWNQLYSAAAGLGNLLADQMVEARQRREAQRLKEWEKREAESMKRYAEEAKAREVARSQMEYYEPRAKAGDVNAMEQMGGLYLSIKENDKSLFWYEKAAMAGSLSAINGLIYTQYTYEILERGPRSFKTEITPLGMRWIDTLIVRGDHERSMHWIGESYGNYDNKKWYDPKKALAIYERFANEGNLTIMMKLGDIYSGTWKMGNMEALTLSGTKGSIKNMGRRFVDGEKALLYYEMCARAKDGRLSSVALRRIADMYATGNGVKKDPAKAAAYETAAKDMAKNLGLSFYVYAEIPFNDGTNSFTPIYTCNALSAEQGGSPADMKAAEEQLKKHLANQYGWNVVNVTSKETLQEALEHRASEWKRLVADRRLNYRDDIRFSFDGRKTKPAVHTVSTANMKDPRITTLPNGVQYKIVTAGTGEPAGISGKTKGNFYSKTIPSGGNYFDRVDGADYDSWLNKLAVKDMPMVLAEIVAIMPAGSNWEIYIPFHLIEPKDYKFFNLNASLYGSLIRATVAINKTYPD